MGESYMRKIKKYINMFSMWSLWHSLWQKKEKKNAPKVLIFHWLKCMAMCLPCGVPISHSLFSPIPHIFSIYIAKINIIIGLKRIFFYFENISYFLWIPLFFPLAPTFFFFFKCVSFTYVFIGCIISLDYYWC